MKEFEFANTNISSQFSMNVMEKFGFMWNPDRTPNLYRVVFYTMADILNVNKSKTNKRIGFTLKDVNGDFKFGAILSYNAPDDGDDEGEDSGNFTLEFTINPEDMNNLDLSYDNHSDLFNTCSTKWASHIMFARFGNFEYCNNLFCECIDTLITFLDTNASDSEEVTMNYKGVFTASVNVEGGIKHISIVPGEMIKQYIKGDATL